MKGVSRMKVCVIFGSPHKKGNTASLLEEYTKKIPKEAEIRIINCYEESVSPCTDCKVCGKTGRCVKKDMDSIYKAVEESDLLIFASPVYNLSFPSPMKAVLDRFQVYFNRRFSLNLRPPIEKPRKAVILLTHDSDKYGGAEHAVTALKMLCTVLNAEVTDIMIKK